VVDAEPVDEALTHPAQDLDVRRVEHGIVLDAHARERGHGEEAPVVQDLLGATPEAQLPVLPCEHVAHGRGIRRRAQRRRSGRERQHEVEVPRRPEAPIRRSRPRHLPGAATSICPREHRVELVAEHRQLTRPPPCAQSMSKRVRVREPSPWVRTSHHGFSDGAATP
jgi:hypothetical protein